MSYTKLFASIVHSTIWQEPDHVRLVWVTMLAMANRDGVVEASVPGLARAAGESIEDTEDALRRFQEPDKYSRTPDNEGRRIEAVPGGWRLLNHALYRGKASREEAREKAAERKRKQREREREAECDKRDMSHQKRDESRHVTKSPQCHDIAEADTDTEKRKKILQSADPPIICLPLANKSEYPITQATVDELAELYPGVDVPAQLREMRGWCIGNPTKRKTRSGIMRFVTSWLAKEQNKPRSAPQSAGIRADGPPILRELQ